MKFQVFNSGRAVEDFELCGAYMFGSDGIAIRRADIRFKDGFIECSKPNMETAGLTLLWPIKGFGRVVLPTTCLPERDKPYNLNLEIARAKLMQIITKREDWSFFNGNDTEELAKESQELFIEAIKNISDPFAASELADRSLQKALVISESLAANQATALLGLRSKNRAMTKGAFGCRIEPQLMLQTDYLSKFSDLFGLAFIPVNWAKIETEQGVYDWSELDKCVELFAGWKMLVGCGPLLSFTPECLPSWLVKGKHSFGKIREAAYNFVAEIAGRYLNIRLWNVISGMNAVNVFGFNFEQILEMTRAATMAVKAANEKAVKIIEITHPWGEYYADNPATIPPLVYIDMVVQSGMHFEAFGLQMKFGKNENGLQMRDLMHISSLLDKLFAIAKPIYITGIEVPSEYSRTEENRAGAWHGSWNEDKQAQWLEQFSRIALSKPFVEALVYANLADSPAGEVEHSGLLKKYLEPKTAYENLRKLQKVLCRR